MKKPWWIVRIIVIVTASYCIFVPGGTYTLPNVAAQGGKCDTSTTCTRNTDNNCYCPVATIGGPGCTGCFIPNGNPGCGSCSGGPTELD
jgi:hypothetical protein